MVMVCRKFDVDFVSFCHSCKDEMTHREFKKQCGASCVYYLDELAVLVALVRIHQWLVSDLKGESCKFLRIIFYVLQYFTDVQVNSKDRAFMVFAISCSKIDICFIKRTTCYYIPQSRSERPVKCAAMLSEIHFRSLRTKMLLQSWMDETARQVEVRCYLKLYLLQTFGTDCDIIMAKGSGHHMRITRNINPPWGLTSGRRPFLVCDHLP